MLRLSCSQGRGCLYLSDSRQTLEDEPEGSTLLATGCSFIFKPLEVCTALEVVTMLGSWPGSNNSNQTQNTTLRAFSSHSFFRKENVISCTFTRSSWHSRAPNTNLTDLIFSEKLVAVPSQKQSTKKSYKLFTPYFSTVTQTPKQPQTFFGHC
jgi:hypothetical protein